MVTADAVTEAAGWSSGAHVVQQGAEDGENTSQEDLATNEETRVFTGVCDDVHDTALCLNGGRGT